MATKQDQQDLKRWYHKARYMEGEGKADRKKRGEDNLSKWTGLGLGEAL